MKAPTRESANMMADAVAEAAHPLGEAAGSALTLQIRLEREDSIPAFGAYLRCECPDPQHNHVILMNVAAVMCPEVEDAEGNAIPMTHDDRKRLLISTLMHEFGHALEQHLGLPDVEEAIEAACRAWDEAYVPNEKADVREGGRK